ncbi:Panacea domain-containing protein [Candidatus Tisiphia endosymbiont of Sialis lutaria]|uniref:Panacea domain-containing protein n=1 Tax=Candidatus Tisiphia endosymbiont of Sialis lutaria TaxID=2029164 RepID=UPI00312CB268
MTTSPTSPELTITTKKEALKTVININKTMQTITGKRILSCLDVANYFLVLVDREAGDTITQLKLQKLIYLAQGVSLSLLDRPLFNEEIEAWEHGFIARDLRRTFGNFKDSAIPTPGEIDFDLYDREEKTLIYKVYAVYGEYTASYLRQLTHEHSIWRDAMATDNKIISKQKMSEFFKRLINTDFLLMSKEDELTIETAEDQWWMNYDSGVLAEDMTNEILQSIEELKAGKGIRYEKINHYGK